MTLQIWDILQHVAPTSLCSTGTLENIFKDSGYSVFWKSPSKNYSASNFLIDPLVFSQLKYHVPLIISGIVLHAVYFETCASFESTTSLIYNIENRGQVGLVISFKFAKDSHTFLFESSRPKYVIFKSTRIMLLLCIYTYRTSKYFQ